VQKRGRTGWYVMSFDDAVKQASKALREGQQQHCLKLIQAGATAGIDVAVTAPTEANVYALTMNNLIPPPPVPTQNYVESSFPSKSQYTQRAQPQSISSSTTVPNMSLDHLAPTILTLKQMSIVR
jgi:hypothetical protein